LLGASTASVVAIAWLYRVRPTVDVPGEVGNILWIRYCLALGSPWKWVVPALAAIVEECVFRGVLFAGMVERGAPLGVAVILSTTAFLVGQIVLTGSRIQVYVLAFSSLAIGLLGSLLTSATEALVPAVVLHASFAGYYTGMGAAANEHRQAIQERS
jgi:membrane protease YdiL (CAAX protease family)